MLTIYEFNLLPNDKKTDVLFENAEFVADRLEGNLSVLLYQLYSFYVEVFYQQDLDEIQRFESFNSTQQLEPYLGKQEIII
jgi:hypothetical protein